MTMGWVAAGTAVLGAASSMYGANKSAKAQKEANAQNAKLAADQNALNYKMWLESQGIGENGQPINTRLPRYMRTRTTTGSGKRGLVKKGTRNTGKQMLTYAAGSNAAPGAIPMSTYGAGGGGGVGPADIGSYGYSTGQYMQ